MGKFDRRKIKAKHIPLEEAAWLLITSPYLRVRRDRYKMLKLRFGKGAAEQAIKDAQQTAKLVDIKCGPFS